MKAATGGVSIGINVDDWDGKQDWNEFLHDRIGGRKFDIVIFARHGGSEGPVDLRMASLFSADSALVSTAAAHYSGNGFVYFHQCYGVFPNGYLDQISKSFSGATVWRAAGRPNVYYGGVRLWEGAFESARHQ